MLSRIYAEIDAVGHRVVHGGESFSGSVIITDEVKKAVRECYPLAPIHNPANITGIEACEEAMPGVPVGRRQLTRRSIRQCLKTSYLYALPMSLYREKKIRKYGFHGASHKYVAERCAALMGKPIEELTDNHLPFREAARPSALSQNGKSVDTTMGFTPLDGCIMGTRCGSIDPAVVTFIMDQYNMTTAEVNDLMNQKSGIYGITDGLSNDFRDLELLYYEKNEKAMLALDMAHYVTKKYIGSYMAAMGGCDAIVFTAGVGENNAFMRKDVLSAFEFMGVKVDDERNNVRGKEALITTDDSTVKAFLIPTNEELAIALETKRLIEK